MYFVYVMAEGAMRVPTAHVVTGSRADLAETRRLVISGSQVDDLLFVSDVLPESQSHHDRSRVLGLKVE